jgi:hypothetical protein
MTTIPQAVTERYVSNLIHYGRNKEFDIELIEQKPNIVEDETVGVYFRVRIKSTSAESLVQSAAAATIAQATRRCLEKHGVTFR